MRKLLIVTAVTVGASPALAQAAEVSVVNPTLATQPPPLLRPATPALSPAFKQQPFPFELPRSAPVPVAPASPSQKSQNSVGVRQGAQPQLSP